VKRFRVLQVRTLGHTLHDAAALEIDPNESGQPPTIQERADTSPVCIQLEHWTD